MRYEAWLQYPTMTVAVQLVNGQYNCIEFGAEQALRKSLKICDSILELKFFLLSLPNSPKKEIVALVNKLNESRAKQTKSSSQ